MRQSASRHFLIDASKFGRTHLNLVADFAEIGELMKVSSAYYAPSAATVEIAEISPPAMAFRMSTSERIIPASYRRHLPAQRL